MNKIFLSFLILIALGMILYSCSTLTNKGTVDVIVYSDVDSVKVFINNDTSLWYKTPAKISVIRSSKDILITAKNDSLKKEVIINSKLSNEFLYGNLLTYGIGYLIDLNSSKRFTYPEFIPIEFKEHTQYQTNDRAWLNPGKGCLNFKISIPEGNHFYQNIGKGYGSTFGFLGISFGAEYYFTDDFCINFDIGGLTDFMMPVPAPVDFMGSHESTFGTYGDIQIGRDFNRFHFDLGLQYFRTSFYRVETLELFPQYIDSLTYSYAYNNIGLSFSIYYKLSNWFNLGLNYYPSFMGWDSNKINWHYTHLFFFEILFKFGYFNLIGA